MQHVLRFTHQELVVLDKALQQMPFGMVAPLIANINKQLAQQKPAEGKPAD